MLVHVYKLNQGDCLTNTMYTNQTGDFLFVSSQINKSIMVIHHVGSKSSWVEPLKNQTEGSLIAAKTMILKQRIVPQHHILNNQCSARMKSAMEETVFSERSISKMTYELVPLD